MHPRGFNFDAPGHWIELFKAASLLHRLQSCFKGNDYLRGLALAAPIEAAA